MIRTVKCERCAYEMSSSERKCPACGALNLKNPVFIASLIIVIIALLAWVGFENAPIAAVKTGEVEDAEVQSEKIPDVFAVGDVVECAGFTVTLQSVTEDTGNDVVNPKTGNVFLICSLRIENNTNEGVYINPMFSFEAYADDYAMDTNSSAYLVSDQSLLVGDVAAGKKIEGIVAYEVPSEWQTFDVVFKNGDVRIQFTANSQ